MICGISAAEIGDWTLGEVVCQIRCVRERDRRRYQALAVIAAGQAQYQGQVFSGSGNELPSIYEIFPFWNDEEQREAQVARIRRRMERHALAGKGR